MGIRNVCISISPELPFLTTVLPLPGIGNTPQKFVVLIRQICNNYDLLLLNYIKSEQTS